MKVIIAILLISSIGLAKDRKPQSIQKPFQRNEITKLNAKKFESWLGADVRNLKKLNDGSVATWNKDSVKVVYEFKTAQNCEYQYFFNEQYEITDVTISSESCVGKHQ